jgi:HSP90 family molecular chaperone
MSTHVPLSGLGTHAFGICGSSNLQKALDRDPKNVSTIEYELFYKTYFLDFTNPITWNHFSGDLGSGVSFRALLYIPGTLSNEFWQGSQTATKDIRLMVKRTFITSDFGEDYLPKWASWVKAIIDGAKTSTPSVGVLFMLTTLS